MGIIFSRKLVLKGSENTFIIPLITLLAGMVVFYFQYYVLISPEMLTSAKSNAAKISLSSLFNEMAFQWLSPFEQLKIIFLVLAVIGGWNLWKIKPIKKPLIIFFKINYYLKTL